MDSSSNLGLFETKVLSQEKHSCKVSGSILNCYTSGKICEVVIANYFRGSKPEYISHYMPIRTLLHYTRAYV